MSISLIPKFSLEIIFKTVAHYNSYFQLSTLGLGSLMGDLKTKSDVVGRVARHAKLMGPSEASLEPVR